MTDQDIINQAVINSGIPTTQEELRSEFEDIAEAEGVPVKNNSSFSAFWRFVSQIFSSPFVGVMDYMKESIMPNLFLKTAKGVFLDFWAYMVNLVRKTETKATGTILYSRIDDAGDADIDDLSIIKTPPINGIVYKVLVNGPHQFLDGESQVLVNVIAELPGKDNNLAEGYYTVLDQPVSGWTVNNESDWLLTPGTDNETDDELRARVRLQFLNVNFWHTDATYRAIMSSFDGVSPDDVYIEHGAPRGPGTANGYIDFNAGSDPSGLVDQINYFINDEGNHGLGDGFLVYALPETEHNLVFAVIAHAQLGLSALEKTDLENNIDTFIRAAFGETDSFEANITPIKPNSDFSISNLENEVADYFSEVFSIQGDAVVFSSGFEIGRIGSLTVTVA